MPPTGSGINSSSTHETLAGLENEPIIAQHFHLDYSLNPRMENSDDFTF